MTSDDTHLNTGKYDPKEYWDARAHISDENAYQAVCVFQYPDCLNKAAERIQKRFLSRAVQATGLTRGRALEFGCGVGRWVKLVSGFGFEYTGADISDEMLGQARTAFPDTAFELIDGTKLPFPDNSFDLVFSITVIHHNPFESQERIVIELERVLRPGGYLLLMEDISHDTAKQPSFNMFIRTPEGWLDLVGSHPNIKLVDLRFVRWWLFTRPATRLLAGLYRLIRGKPMEGDAWNSLYGRAASAVVKMLSAVDLGLHSVLPRQASNDAVMLFRKDRDS